MWRREKGEGKREEGGGRRRGVFIARRHRSVCVGTCVDVCMCDVCGVGRGREKGEGKREEGGGEMYL